MNDAKTKTEKRTEEKSLQELLTNMDATTYRLNLLCNRFEKDKDIILKEGVDIKSAVKTLQIEIAAFARMRGEIGELISNKINRASEEITSSAEKSVQKALSKDVDSVVYRLDKAADIVQKKLLFFYDLDQKRIWQMVIGLIVLPLAASFLVAKFAMPKPVSLNVDGKTCEAYVKASRGF